MIDTFIFLSAYVLDLLIGDPAFIPHPVVLIGKFIDRGEKLLRRFAADPGGERVAGAVLAVVTVVMTYTTVFWLIRASYILNFWVGVITNVWVLSMTFAAKGLAVAGRNIHDLLVQDKLEEARKAVGMVVGRDTENLPAREVVRATVETVAENLVDGVIAPLFYAVLGGAPLAMAYKAVNTLDSMIGYKNDRYKNFGWFAARLDDAANFLPARVVIPLLLTAAALLKLDVKAAWKTIRRDAAKHPSPNGGIPESLVAGALGIQLGGLNYYFGQPSFRATMGDKRRNMEPVDIETTVKLMHLSAGLAVLMGSAVVYLFNVAI